MRRFACWSWIVAIIMVLALVSISQGAVVVLGERAGRRDYAGLSIDIKPTVAVMYGSTFYVTDLSPPVLYIYTGEGWVVDYRPMPPKS